jgi:hypothetical protein
MERCDQVLDFFATSVVFAPLRETWAAKLDFTQRREESGRREEESN